MHMCAWEYEEVGASREPDVTIDRPQRHEKLHIFMLRSTYPPCICRSSLLLKRQHQVSDNPTAAERTVKAPWACDSIPPGSN